MAVNALYKWQMMRKTTKSELISSFHPLIIKENKLKLM